MPNEEMVTIVSEAGKQVQVPAKEYYKTHPEAALFAKGQPVAPEPVDVNPLATNDAYIDAHGPAEPIRGRFVAPESQHPGIARNVAMGELPNSEPLRAHGRFAMPSARLNPELMVDEAKLAHLEEVYGEQGEQKQEVAASTAPTATRRSSNTANVDVEDDDADPLKRGQEANDPNKNPQTRNKQALLNAAGDSNKVADAKLTGSDPNADANAEKPEQVQVATPKSGDNKGDDKDK